VTARAPAAEALRVSSQAASQAAMVGADSSVVVPVSVSSSAAVTSPVVAAADIDIQSKQVVIPSKAQVSVPSSWQPVVAMEQF
jgi:hypothetical protein